MRRLFLLLAGVMAGEQCTTELASGGCLADCGPASPVCGNNVVETGEACDGNCPTSCDDGNACTTDTLTGSAATCSAQCAYSAVTACVSGDGCCPSGCSSIGAKQRNPRQKHVPDQENITGPSGPGDSKTHNAQAKKRSSKSSGKRAKNREREN